jgi:hypothetical protein
VALESADNLKPVIERARKLQRANEVDRDLEGGESGRNLVRTAPE